jgi:hypothetical protein
MTRPNLSLGIPDLKAFAVKTKRSPIIRVNQAHRVSRCAVTREATIFNPVPNELPKDIRDYIDRISILICPINKHFATVLRANGLGQRPDATNRYFR